MRHLPKHLRPRWRYLAVALESWPDAAIDRGTFQRELWYAAQNLLGDPGSADTDLTVFDFSFADGAGEAVVRTRRGHASEARAALACIDEVDGRPLGVRVMGASGTVRACEERYLGRRAGRFDERSVVFANESRSAYGDDEVADVCGPDGFTGATELDFE